MNKIRQIEALLLRSRRLPWVVLAVVFLALATVIFLTARPIRDSIREQMIRREGDILQAVVLARLGSLVVDEGLEDPSDPISQLDALLSISQLEGEMMGIRLWDAQGGFVTSVPPLLMEQEVSRADLSLLRSLKPVCRFQPSAFLHEQFYAERVSDLEHPIGVSLLQVYVPLYLSGDPSPLGIAQFVIDGTALAAEFRRLDRRLWQQGAAVFLVAGTVVGAALGWAFRRLHRLHLQLAERTDSLLQANAELALAARTSALGAITSHLVHGLRSPMAGIQNLVAAGNQDDTGPGPEDWEQAAASVRRMQNLMAEVVQVLQEHPEADQYRVSLGELLDQVAARTRTLAHKGRVNLETACSVKGWLDNRAANLIRLILVNLVENGLQVTPPGGGVSMTVTRSNGDVICRVVDQGDGVPEMMKPQLFKPVVSTKEGGSGLGLAISRQLAQHLGVQVELEDHSGGGAVFSLRIPDAVLHAEERPDRDLASSWVRP